MINLCGIQQCMISFPVMLSTTFIGGFILKPFLEPYCIMHIFHTYISDNVPNFNDYNFMHLVVNNDFVVWCK